jgi:hypothetical protein
MYSAARCGAEIFGFGNPKQPAGFWKWNALAFFLRTAQSPTAGKMPFEAQGRPALRSHTRPPRPWSPVLTGVVFASRLESESPSCFERLALFLIVLVSRLELSTGLRKFAEPPIRIVFRS